MNKRKASNDRNVKQKTASRRPSSSSLHARPNTIQPKILKPEKSPSTQDLTPKEPQTCSKPVQVSKAVDTSHPKTRFSSQDRSKELRSCSSPRLKYFPAEKIKKLESPPLFTPSPPIGALIAQQNSNESGAFYVAGQSEQCNNNGQGDAAAAAQSFQQHRQPQSMQTVSQQQVPHQTMHRVSRINPHSECTLPQQILNNQAHRPFVPHGPQDYSQRNPAEPHNSQSAYHSSPPMAVTPQPVAHQIPNSSASTMDEVRSKSVEPVNAVECPDYEKQPIGGRNAAIYRQMMTNKQQQPPPQSQTSMEPNSSSYPMNDPQRQRDRHPNHGHVSQNANPQDPRQIYQQLQQNTRQQMQMQQQMQLQQRAMNHRMQLANGQQPMDGHAVPYDYNAQQLGTRFPQGTTSPRDATTSQKCVRTAGPVQNQLTRQRDLDYATSPQNAWAKGNPTAEYSSTRAQLKPYSIELVNNDQQQQSCRMQYQQAAQQPKQLYRNAAQCNPMTQNQPAHVPVNQPGFDRQTSALVNPDRRATLDQQPNPQVPLENDPDEQTVKKRPSSRFTAGMIRDQEKLVATMKQQGVPLDIMKRQFDILLNEQRRHLEYLEQLQRQEEAAQDVRKAASNPRRKRDADEKPEWMAHLTPSRLSYLELERMHEQRRKEREVQRLEEFQRQQRRNANEMSGAQQIPVQLQSQVPQRWQANWQQSNGVPQGYGNTCSQPYVVSGANDTNDPMKSTPDPSTTSYQHQQNAPSYQYAAQHPQQHNPQAQRCQQQRCQNVPRQNHEQMQTTNEASVHEQGRQTTEASSLLKMRRYKNEIRPQRRNNGLQDPAAARKHLEEFRVTAEARRGLEYLANLAPKKQLLKLNGMQDRSETETEIQRRLMMSSVQPAVKRVPANGLENTRNPDNPPPQRMTNLKRMEQEYLKEYPRQKQNDPRMCYNVQAEKENGAVTGDQQSSYVQQQIPTSNPVALIPYNEKNHPTLARGSPVPFMYDGPYPQHYRQTQQYHQNARNFAKTNGEGDVGVGQRTEPSKGSFEQAGGDAYGIMNANGQMTDGKVPFRRMNYNQSNIHEAKTIGGVTYLARKQDYLPSQQVVAPETLIASKHLQPPMMY